RPTRGPHHAPEPPTLRSVVRDPGERLDLALQNGQDDRVGEGRPTSSGRTEPLGVRGREQGTADVSDRPPQPGALQPPRPGRVAVTETLVTAGVTAGLDGAPHRGQRR